MTLKNIQFSSREADFKALVIFSCLAFSGLVGFMLPAQLFALDEPTIHFDNALIAAALAVFVCSLFGLVEPRRYGRKWLLAKYVGRPVIWFALVILLAVWFHHFHENDFEVFQTMQII